MRTPHRYATLLSLALVTGCGDATETDAPDTPDPTSDTDTPAADTDTPAADTDTPAADTDTLTGDSDTEVACDPAACPAAPAPTCADAETVSTLAPACQADGTCGFAETLTPCAAFESCEAGACTPTPLCAIDFDAEADLGAITDLRLGGGATQPDACCEDLTGDGAIDNRVGATLAALSTLSGTDPNALLAERMATGDLSWSVVTSPADPADPTAVHLDLLPSLRDDVDPGAWLAGASSMVAFAADAAVLDLYSPQSRWTGHVGPGDTLDAVGTVHLPVLLFGLTLDLPVTQAHLRGTLVRAPAPSSTMLSGPNGAAELSGMIRRTDLWDAENAAYAASCACATVNSLSGLLIDATGRCANVDAFPCADEGLFDLCSGLPSFCTATQSFLNADVDSDGDGLLDAVSVGWRIGARTAADLRVDTCAP